MKIKLMILAIATFLFIGGCSMDLRDSDSEEAENKIVLERYGMFTLAEFQFQRVTITPNNITFETFGPDMNRTGMTSNSIETAEFNRLLAEFENFNSLDKKYTSSVPIADIGAGNITLSGENGSYSVVVDPWVSQGNPDEISKLVSALNDFIATNVEFPTLEDDESEGDVLSMTYQGVQCVDEPWEMWYNEGNINYIQEPTDEQLIIDYYAQKGVEIETINTFSQNVCSACEICADSKYFEIMISSNHTEILEEDGWTLN